jgi:hypothetical protein
VIAQSVKRLGYGLDDRGSRFDSRRGLGIFLFTTASRTALGPTQPPIQWVTGALSLRVKRPWREADHSLPSSADVKEWVELYLYSPNTPSWRGAQLKHRDNFTFYLISLEGSRITMTPRAYTVNFVCIKHLTWSFCSLCLCIQHPNSTMLENIQDCM